MALSLILFDHSFLRPSKIYFRRYPENQRFSALTKINYLVKLFNSSKVEIVLIIVTAFLQLFHILFYFIYIYLFFVSCVFKFCYFHFVLNVNIKGLDKAQKFATV